MPSLSDIASIIITFLLSGILGVLFQRWLSRAKPQFIITSVGFKGSEKLLKVPQRLVSISDENAWLHLIKPYSYFDDLLNEHKHVTEVIEKLKLVIPIAENWLKDNEQDNPKALSFGEIKKHLYSNSFTVSGAIDVMIQRDELRDVPIQIEKVLEFERITELSENEDGLILFLGEKGIQFGLTDLDTENQKKAMILLAESFARGVKQNINYYTRSFVNASNNNIRTLSEVKKLLEDTLLPETRLSVELSIYNSGQSPIAIRPHMALKILHPNFDKEFFVLSVQKNQTRRTQASDDQRQTYMQGSEVVIESFLPETSTNPYVGIAPGEMKEVFLIASESLGSINGEKVKNIYQTGLLKCKVLGQTITDKKIWSSPATFSSNITETEKSSLVERVRK